MRLFHRHQWQTVEQTMMPSAYEQMGPQQTAENVPAWFFQKKLVVEQRCEACGAYRMLAETNP